MPFRSARLAKILYRFNVGRSDGEVLPLGVLARLGAKKDAPLVLMARSKLDAGDRAKMDWAAQQLLGNPIEFLKGEIDAALQTGVSDVFAHLARKLNWSIYMAPPVRVSIPREIAADIEKAIERMSRRRYKMRKVDAEHRLVSHAVSSPTFPPKALAQMAGPEFPPDTVQAYAPPPWMIADVDAGNLIRR